MRSLPAGSSIRAARTAGPAVALIIALALAAVGCGGDDEAPDPAAPLAFEDWRVLADQFCSDGTQEALALPLPGDLAEISADAGQRAEIVLVVRDGIVGLGAPEGKEAAVDAYLDELTADAKLLEEIRRTAGDGIDTSGLQTQVDESAGQAALELELIECAGFSNVIARTP